MTVVARSKVFLNDFPRAAEFVSAHLDTALRKGLASASDEAADATLDAVLQIFRCAVLAQLVWQRTKAVTPRGGLIGRGLN